MKLRKLIIIPAITLSLLGMGVAFGNQSVSAKNKEFTNINTHSKMVKYPKSVRGTWYSYDKYDGLVTTKIYAKKMKETTSKKFKGVPQTITTSLHKYVSHKVLRVSKKEYNQKQNWIYIDSTFTTHKQGRTAHWFSVYGWYQSAGAPEAYSLNNINGHQVLAQAGGADNWIDSFNYRTPQLAKSLATKKYSGFNYRTE